MTKILYVGPYREFSGMGNAARKYLQALNIAGYDLTIRPSYNLYKPYPEEEINTDILKLEKNHHHKYDVCIQHCYPHQVYTSSRFDKNICIMHLESGEYREDLSNYLIGIDKLVVGSSVVKNTLVGCGIDKDSVFVIPEPIDIKSIHSYREINPKHLSSEFHFYSIGDFSQRKNLETIVLAFSILSTEFDNISLTIKTNKKPSCNLDEHCIKDAVESTNSMFPISENIRKKAKIVLGYTEYKNILSLHNTSDCYINLSSGDSFGYSTLEAMAFDNNIIVTSGIGSQDIIGKCNTLEVESSYSNCQESYKNYYMYNSVHNMWHVPSLNSLVSNMRKAILENHLNKTDRIICQRNHVAKFDMENVSKIWQSVV